MAHHRNHVPVVTLHRAQNMLQLQLSLQLCHCFFQDMLSFAALL